jgi:hypothetical protein
MFIGDLLKESFGVVSDIYVLLLKLC